MAGELAFGRLRDAHFVRQIMRVVLSILKLARFIKKLQNIRFSKMASGAAIWLPPGWPLASGGLYWYNKRCLVIFS